MPDRTGALRALAAASRSGEVWVAAEHMVRRSRSRMPAVNVSKIDRLAEDDRPILVPGKVLGTGDVKKKVNVGALSFSAEARRKIEETGGHAFSIPDFVKKFAKSGGVLLVGG